MPRPASRIPHAPHPGDIGALILIAVLVLGPCQLVAGDAPAPGKTVVRIREPRATSYRLTADPARSTRGGRWLEAVREADGMVVDLGPRLVVRVEDPARLPALRARLPSGPVLDFDASTVVVDLADAREALDVAAVLASDPDVAWATPVRRHRGVRPTAWGGAPDDPFFDRQYPLDATGVGNGFAPAAGDLNVRSAWPHTRGEGVTIAFFDDGLDVTHPDLGPNLVPELHRNYFTQAGDGRHSNRSQYHGTSVAGLAVAPRDNGVGIAGVAPGARGTAWVIFDATGNLPDTARLADAFGNEVQRVGVQNHSWGNADFAFLEPTAIERLAISNALTHGRGGLGVVMVRSAGNTRIRNYFGSAGIGDLNADGFGNEPGAMAVASVRRDGRVASYSTPGAAVLVAAPGGEAAEGSQVFTLDPVGDAGRSTVGGSGPELADYLSGARATPGTSYSAPLISGVAALMLAARPDLHRADLQILLALASRPTDRTEAQRRPNGAGLSWSPDTGFGMPDAGEAVRRALALASPGRPRVRIATTAQGPVTIPDDGLAVEVRVGGGSALRFAAAPGTGLHPDPEAGPWRPLVDVGTASLPIVEDLSGRAVLIRRTAVPVADAIQRAADAGAVLAVVTHDAPGNGRVLLAQTDGVRIPAVLVGQQDGDTARTLLGGPGAVEVRTTLQAARFPLVVDPGLVLDAVQVRITAGHTRAGDLRVTVRSPAGTTSVLQRATHRSGAQVPEWWYSSKQHLLEGGRGAWEVAVSDESPGAVGSIGAVELILTGVGIGDLDADGLDDDWERTHWGDLGAAPDGDDDLDGWTHAAEQFLGTDPRQDDRPPDAALAWSEPGRLRLAWPVGRPGTFEVLSASDPAGPFLPVGTAHREPPEGAWFLSDGLPGRFLRVRQVGP